MSRPDAEVADYYENEARLRLRGAPSGRRVELRGQFIERLGREGRTTVLDVGAGPGLDGEGFRAADLEFVGVDLANGNGVLAAQSGLIVVQGSATALPIKASSFEAGWSLSTLMHLDAADAATALAEIVQALQPNAPLWIGLWGCETAATIVNDAGIPGSRRSFHLRRFDHNQQLVATHSQLEEADVWESASGDWDYHVFRLRTPG